VTTGELQDQVIEAARAAIPAGLLASLGLLDATPLRAQSSGRVGLFQASTRRGRPAGVRKGSPRAGIPLNVIETLRAAAPWQRMRRQQQLTRGTAATARIDVRPEDFHITRYRQRTGTTTVFVLDASGSSALQRLGEAKGAVELLLADCYVRRDQVAVLAFRGRTAEVLLPPTRSLVRAKRSLGSLPGGGGTPLAAGIEAASVLADGLRRRGMSPTVVLLTDGRGNVARDGSTGRSIAEADALKAAAQLRGARISCLLIDTSNRPTEQAMRLAGALGARYVPLPHASSAALVTAVQGAQSAQRAVR
jgi:magnesium chelatase subunit D